MKKLKIVCLLGVIGVMVIGCGSGASADDAAVNADVSKPGDKAPPALDQGTGAAGAPSTPSTTQTGP